MQLATFQPRTRDRKLAPVAFVDRGRGRLEPVATGPFLCTTYLPIRATCPASCRFLDNGCYAHAGAARSVIAKLDAAAVGRSPADIIRDEVVLIDSFSERGVPRDGGRHGRDGRDLRLHVSGDVGGTRDARMLASAAARWIARGGGAVWSYTHRWATIPREAWGPIEVLASVESVDDALDALGRGYEVALVLPKFERNGPYMVTNQLRVLPCPAQTRMLTCVSCRACMSRPSQRGLVIGFEVHGPAAAKARRALPVLGSTARAVDLV